MTNFTFLLDLKHILIFSNNLKKVCITDNLGDRLVDKKQNPHQPRFFLRFFFEIFLRIFLIIFLRIFLRNLLDNHTNQIFFLSIIMSRSVVHLTYFLDKKRYGCEEHCF